jgi:hypothetical protein
MEYHGADYHLGKVLGLGLLRLSVLGVILMTMNKCIGKSPSYYCSNPRTLGTISGHENKMYYQHSPT